MSLNLIGVIRHSTAEQVSEGRAGVERQRHDIETVQRATGANIIRTIEVIESGALVLDNNQFKRLFRDLADPSVDGVACSALDRLVRPDKFSDMGIFDYFKLNGKRIYTPNGVIDPNTQSGWVESIMRATFAGMEREAIRTRCMSGKERLRLQKRHVNGAHALPRGVLFDKATGIWSYDLDPNDPTPRPKGHRAGDALMIQTAFDLFVYRNLSYQAIADTVGNGWTNVGIRDTLRNPIWIGIRRYDKERTGPVIRSKTIREDGEPTKYRKLGPRSQVIEQRVIEKGLIPESLFQRAQEVARGRAAIHGHRKRDPRFLASGFLRCSCGKPWYARSGSGRVRRRDYYYCAGHCGAPSLQRKAVDGTIISLLSRELLKLEVLQQILGEIPKSAPGAEGKRSQASAKLDQRYARLLDLYQNGDINREQFNERKKAIETDRAALAVLYPVPQRKVAVDQLALALVEAFTGFHQLLYSEQRAILQRAVTRIMMNGRTMASMTLSGGFLGEMCAKVVPHSTQRYWHRSRAPGLIPRST
jgi:DNA invertase Pin-like site-specific DNA recombinase